eukprot:Rmarinus@m.27785
MAPEGKNSDRVNPTTEHGKKGQLWYHGNAHTRPSPRQDVKERRAGLAADYETPARTTATGPKMVQTEESSPEDWSNIVDCTGIPMYGLVPRWIRLGQTENDQKIWQGPPAIFGSICGKGSDCGMVPLRQLKGG